MLNAFSTDFSTNMFLSSFLNWFSLGETKQFRGFGYLIVQDRSRWEVVFVWWGWWRPGPLRGTPTRPSTTQHTVRSHCCLKKSLQGLPPPRWAQPTLRWSRDLRHNSNSRNQLRNKNGRHCLETGCHSFSSLSGCIPGMKCLNFS